MPCWVRYPGLLGNITLPLYSNFGLSSSAASVPPMGLRVSLSRQECTQGCWPRLPHCLTTHHGHSLLGPLHEVVHKLCLHPCSRRSQGENFASSSICPCLLLWDFSLENGCPDIGTHHLSVLTFLPLFLLHCWWTL